MLPYTPIIKYLSSPLIRTMVGHILNLYNLIEDGFELFWCWRVSFLNFKLNIINE